MVSIPISWSTCIYGDNMSVVHNTSKSESILKKKYFAVVYDAIYKSVAMAESLVAHISSEKI